MRARTLAALGVVALLAAVAAGTLVSGATAQGDHQPDRVRLLAIFRTLEYGDKAFLSGQMRHLPDPDARIEPYPDRRVVLEEAPYPHTTWTAVAETTTDQEGYFSFTRQPGANTRYRVRTFDPPLVSEEPIVRVRVRVGVRAERARVARGRRARLSGTVAPAHDGQTVLLQRKGSRGRFATIARTRLRTVSRGGVSRFVFSVRAPRTAEYRVRMPADGDHLPGMSRTVTVAVAGR